MAGVYERVEALNAVSRRRAVGASERTASRTVFGAIPPGIADTLASDKFRAYEHRSIIFLGLTAAFVVFCLGNAWLLRDSPGLLIAAIVGIFFIEDFFSGVLHIVLDDPRNITSPLFARGALEFQAHHVLPKDIVRKPFFDVLGDLNPIVIGHLVVLGAITHFQNPVVNLLLGGKLLFAWWGQFSHRMAHESPDKRSGWV
ncbi:MAG: fatty acid desaturase CarF family protein, partial [Myxococcota bacterium]